jgi:hypothetical protein
MLRRRARPSLPASATRREVLAAGRGVVADASFIPRGVDTRLPPRRSPGAPALFLYCQADPETIRRRLDARSGGPSERAGPHTSNNARSVGLQPSRIASRRGHRRRPRRRLKRRYTPCAACGAAAGATVDAPADRFTEMAREPDPPPALCSRPRGDVLDRALASADGVPGARSISMPSGRVLRRPGASATESRSDEVGTTARTAEGSTFRGRDRGTYPVEQATVRGWSRPPNQAGR